MLYNNRELQRLESITNSPILSHFAETIQGVATIRAYNQESRFMEILFKRLEANNIAVIIQNTSNRWLGIGLVCILMRNCFCFDLDIRVNFPNLSPCSMK